MYILGISAFYHDSAAALIKDGVVVAACEEERLSRKKHDNSFPKQSVLYCLKEAGIDLKDVTHIAFYEKPFIKFERLLLTYFSEAPKGFPSFVKALPVWLKEKLFLKTTLISELKKLTSHLSKKEIEDRLLFSEHHLSHAASAFYPSPFENAAIITLDGVGEYTTSSIAFGDNSKIKILEEVKFPHSLGLLYSAFTYYCGFKVNDGEYKLMGLAPYGKPRFTSLIKENLIDVKEDGSFHLDLSYFNYMTGLTMTNRKFENLFGHPPRKSESELTDFYKDIAASIQVVTEEIILKIAKHTKELTGCENLCLAGGVALNCVANGKLLEENIFQKIWIQPAAGDSGGALGCALDAYFRQAQMQRIAPSGDQMHGALLGPHFDSKAIETSLKGLNASYEYITEADLFDKVAEYLNQGLVIGWHQGRMEFGPRALGNRSILGDPRDPKMQSLINQKIKFRESFRPFAPAVLKEDVTNYFKINAESPYMLLVSQAMENAGLPAITHVDGSARIQTVDQKMNPRFYKLIEAFKKRTGCSVLINTSFNVRGEPIVCTPEDSYKCFLKTNMDVLVIDQFVLKKEI